MRLFTTTAPSKATHTLFNPQNDEDGNEMLLEITERAAKARYSFRPFPPLYCASGQTD